jgi:hypothetical protein
VGRVVCNQYEKRLLASQDPNVKESCSKIKKEVIAKQYGENIKLGI